MWIWFPIVLFLTLLLHGALLGPTDDEAYYWLLAQTPSLGFAFHPPGVLWLIILFEKTVGPLVHSILGMDPHPLLLRMPAAFS